MGNIVTVEIQNPMFRYELRPVNATKVVLVIRFNSAAAIINGTFSLHQLQPQQQQLQPPQQQPRPPPQQLQPPQQLRPQHQQLRLLRHWHPSKVQ